MGHLTVTQKVITAWYILSIALVGCSFDASVEAIIGITINLAVAVTCLEWQVIDKKGKEDE